MMIRGKDVALSLLGVGVAAAAGYVLRATRRRVPDARSKANIGARIVDPDEVPADAAVVDATSDRLESVPGARRAIERAIRNGAREEWEHVTIDEDGAWTVVDRLRRSLPYHESEGADHNGVFVRFDGGVVVVDAIGWAHLEEPLQ